MLLLAHTGITLGVFDLCRRIYSRISSHPEKKKKKLVYIAKSSPTLFESSPNPDPLKNPEKRHIDYRFILLGSIFPDIVDKPLGMLIFSGVIANGRIYTHTLLVNLVLLFMGMYLLKRKGANFLAFSLASCFHLVLDEMWLDLQTLLWPLYGWGFPKQVISHWWEHILQGLFTNPWVYLPEIIGAVILLGFGIVLAKRRMMKEFLFRGKLP